MAGRATREALLRLRQVAEAQARRALEVARRQLASVETERVRAVAHAERTEARLLRAEAPTKARAAGRLVSRETFLGELRAAVADARDQAVAAARAVAAAEKLVEDARGALESAVRAREASDAHQEAVATRESRLKVRREETATDDRWRKKK